MCLCVSVNVCCVVLSQEPCNLSALGSYYAGEECPHSGTQHRAQQVC